MDAETAILTALSTSPDASIPDTLVFAEAHSLSHNTIVGTSKSLSTDAYISLSELSSQFYTLTSEAESILANGSQECIVIAALIAAGEDGLSMTDLQNGVGKDVCKIGMGNCLKNKWARKEKDGRLVAQVEGVEDEVKVLLGKLKEGGGGADVLDDKVCTIEKDGLQSWCNALILRIHCIDNAFVCITLLFNSTPLIVLPFSTHPSTTLTTTTTLLRQLQSSNVVN
jgi:phenylalanyl-tRNA synthetase alpha chain